MYKFFRKYPNTFLLLGIILMLYFFVTYLTDVTTYVVLAGLLAYLCVPIVTFFVKKNVSHRLVISIVFILILALFILLFSILIPNLINQLIQFIYEIPAIYESIVDLVEKNDISFLEKFDLESTLLQYKSNIIQLTNKLVVLITQKAQGFGFSLIFIPLLFYYFLRDYQRFSGIVDLLFPKSKIPEVKEFMNEYNVVLSSYFRGQVIIAIMVAVASWITLTAFQLNFALVIAILGGLLNFVPVLGPLIASVPALLLALLKSPWTALLVGTILFFINQVTSVIIFPSIISKQIKLSPIIIIIAVLAAGNLIGVVGVLLVLPIIILLKLFWVKYVRPELDQL